MNKKITLQDIIEGLIQKHSMERKDAEAFVKGMFDLIEDTLSSEKLVKIKGLGTFKLIEVDSRESINVNSGERFRIEGHSKVSFTPDASLKNIINKPFSHFETVVLNDNTNLEDTDVVVENPSAITSDESSEDIQTNTYAAESPAEENVEKDSVVEEPITEELVVKAEPAVEVAPEPEPTQTETIIESQPVNEETEEKVAATDNTPIAEESVVENETQEEETQEIEITPTVEEEETLEEPSSEDKRPTVPEVSEEAADTKVEDFIEPTPSIEKTEAIPASETVTVSETIAAGETKEEPKEKEVHAETAEAAATTINERYKAEERITVEPAKPVQQEKNNKKLNIIFYIAIAVIIAFACFLFYIFSDNSSSLPPTEESAVIADTLKTKPDTVAAALPASEDSIKKESEVVQKKVEENVKPETKVEAKKPEVKAETKKTETKKPEAKEETRSTSTNKVYDETLKYRISGIKTTHTIEDGEGLMRISLKYYGTKKLYTYIMEYNKNTIGENGDKIRIGMKIKIPELKPIK